MSNSLTNKTADLSFTRVIFSFTNTEVITHYSLLHWSNGLPHPGISAWPTEAAQSNRLLNGEARLVTAAPQQLCNCRAKRTLF